MNVKHMMCKPAGKELDPLTSRNPQLAGWKRNDYVRYCMMDTSSLLESQTVAWEHDNTRKE